MQGQRWKIDRLLESRSDWTQFGPFRFQMDARNRQVSESDADAADRHGFLPVRHRGVHLAVLGIGGNLVEQMKHEPLVVAVMLAEEPGLDAHRRFHRYRVRLSGCPLDRAR